MPSINLEWLYVSVKLARVFRTLAVRQSENSDQPPYAAAQGGAIMGTHCHTRRLATAGLVIGLVILADPNGMQAE